MSKIDIINNGLVMLRQSPLASLDQDDDIATAAKVVYEQCRQSLLAKHSWNFALKQEKLTQLAAKPAFRWEYQYQLPNDFITVVRVNDNIDYRLQGGAILTDEDQCYMTYVYNHTIADHFAPHFASTLSAYIASSLAYAITGTSSVKEMAYMEYKQKLEEAMNIDDRQDYQERMGQQSSILISARYR